MNDVATTRPIRVRVEEERSRRRRRDDMGDGRFRNLDVAGDLDPNYVYRWINDDPGRVHNLTVRDDWDRVTDEMLGLRHEKDRQIGSGVERIADKASGKRTILVRKPRDYYEKDKAREQARLDALDAEMKLGVVRPGPDGQQGLQVGVNAYVPAGGISIQDGRRG